MYLYILMTNFLQTQDFDFFKITKIGDNAVAIGILLVVYSALKLVDTIYKNRKSDKDIWVEVVKANTTAMTTLSERLEVLPKLEVFLIRSEEREREKTGKKK